MLTETFEKLDLAEVATIVDEVNPLLEGTKFDPVETTVMAAELPFYPGFRLLDIADHSAAPPVRRYAIRGPRKTTVLNFSNDPIYALNAALPIKLSESNVPDYARFFFAFVRGKHGRFIIAENVDDIHWREDPPPQARKAIGKMTIPVTLLRTDPDGAYQLQATMMFKDSLFKSNISVKPDGLVNLYDEELLVEDMPVLDDTFGQ